MGAAIRFCMVLVNVIGDVVAFWVPGRCWVCGGGGLQHPSAATYLAPFDLPGISTCVLCFIHLICLPCLSRNVRIVRASGLPAVFKQRPLLVL
mmetsp:Transcript_24551/g.62358  ORF Transcript_24551/g.62358 Transcript_24551/m.62358 type:complete len:93 (+) Transcript_24551:2723-3001(+)